MFLPDPLLYYQPSKKRKPNPLLHVTAKYCGHLPCSPYSEKAQACVGSEFSLAIVGLYFTDRSFGLRVKLTKEQDNLFDDERKLCHQNSLHSEDEAQAQNSIATKDPSKEKHPRKHRHSKDYPGISFVSQRENYQPTNSRAHITIGCAPKVKAYKAGEDLLDIIDLERRSSTLHHDYKIPGGTLRQFGRHGDYAFMIYPQNRVMAKAVFMPFV